jgi:hypothetical protein
MPLLLVLLALMLASTTALAASAGAGPSKRAPPPSPEEVLAALAAAPPELTPAQARRHASAKQRTLELLASVDPNGNNEEASNGTTTALSSRAPLPPSTECGATNYRNRVLGELKIANFLGLFKDLENQTKLEASGMDVVGDRELYVVFDNTPLVGLVDLHFTYEDVDNELIPPARANALEAGAASASEEAEAAPSSGSLPWPPKLRGGKKNGATDSQFEGISAIPSRPGEFIIVEEMREVSGDDDDDEEADKAAAAAGGRRAGRNRRRRRGRRPPGSPLYFPFAQRVSVSRGRTDIYRVLERCAVHVKLAYENKGVEGIQYIEDVRGKGYLMAMCEGNWCAGGKAGREPGHGRVVVLEYRAGDGTAADPCGWHPTKVLHIPIGASFIDYSDIAFADPGQVSIAGPSGDPATKGAVVVLSQENSAMWIGMFDFDKLEFDMSIAGAAFLLPRNSNCDMIYCNAEGIAWLDSTRLAIATDRAKSTQPFRCTNYDETLGVFALPDGAAKLIGGGGWGEGEMDGGEEAQHHEEGEEAQHEEGTTAVV